MTLATFLLAMRAASRCNLAQTLEGPMRDHLWTFKTARFTVLLDCEYEQDPDLSWDDTGEVREKLDSGEWGNFCFIVRVLFDGREIAADYLGNSIYEDPADFAREHYGIAPMGRAAGVLMGAYFPGMVREAVAEARKTLCAVPHLRCP
jgi:hypothetical protein